VLAKYTLAAKLATIIEVQLNHSSATLGLIAHKITSLSPHLRLVPNRTIPVSQQSSTGKIHFLSKTINDTTTSSPTFSSCTHTSLPHQTHNT
jgi:hypothetical protein